MNCPRHQTELQSQTVDGHRTERCPECDGMWIAGTEVDNLLGSGELLKLRSLCSVRKSDLVCPQDGHVLWLGKVGPVALDLCQSCNGLWLDPGEIEELQKRKGLSPHVPSAPEGPPSTAVSGSSELILYGLLAMTGL